MNLQSYLEQAFCQWQPPPPSVVARSQHDVTLFWKDPELDFLKGELIYRVERKEKLPPWVTEYCGGRTTKRIDNLAPCCPHKFRLRVIVKAEAVSHLADRAIEYYGSEDIAFKTLKNGLFKDVDEMVIKNDKEEGGGDIQVTVNVEDVEVVNEEGDTAKEQHINKEITEKKPERKWLQSQWSELMCTSTESGGTSAVCFCMAVRGGYLKHVQSMLEERPELVGIISNTNGYTPLATAVRRGDISMVKLLLAAGAEVDQLSTSGQMPLHIAALSAAGAIVDLLLEKGAHFQARDKVGMRIEHYAVDSGDLGMLRHVLDLGGDVSVRDSNHWTPLFRAVIQGAPRALVEELVDRGSSIDIVDRAGLTIPTAARLLFNRHGKPRHSIMRLVDEQYPREKALANFTRLTKKISSVHSMIKPGSPSKQTTYRPIIH